MAAQEFGRRCQPPMDPAEVDKVVSSIASRDRRAHGDEPMLVILADVEPEEVEFLWRPYIPLRKSTLIEGDPGVGKTHLACAIAADISRGRLVNEGEAERREPATVLYLTAEDGLADTLRPRLDALGADVERITVLEGVIGRDGKPSHFTLKQNLGALETALAKVNPVLVVMDPIQGFLGSVDMHRANEVRPLMSGMARLAERYGCAVVAVRHLRKSASERAIHRGLGSIDFTAAVRSVLLVAPDPDTPNRSIMAHAKANLSMPGESLAFEIRDGVFTWLGGSTPGANDLFPGTDSVKPRRQDVATDFLLEALAEGPRPVPELRGEAEAAGVSWRTVERAKANLGVVARRQGFGSGGVWQWELPKDRQTANEESGGLWRRTAQH